MITDLEEQEKSIQADPNDLDKLRRQVEQLEDETAQMEEVEFGDKVREFLGDGNRQYLTGLKLGGERVLILVDGSASMLADTVVNAVRRRNMRRRAEKTVAQMAVDIAHRRMAAGPAASQQPLSAVYF